MNGTSYKVWESPSGKAVFLLVHGLGANSTWWDALGSFLLKNSFSSYAVDLKNNDSFKTFSQDILNVRHIIKKVAPGKKIFALGESMGSLVLLSMALKDGSLFDGIICMSPAFKSSSILTIQDYIKIFLPLCYNPKKRYKLPFRADMCTRDAAYIKIIEADYNKDILSTSRVLFDVFISQLRAKFFTIKLDKPVLFLLGGEDKMVDGAASKIIFNKIKTADKKIIEYPGMYHSLSIEIGKEKVFQDIVQWAVERL